MLLMLPTVSLFPLLYKFHLFLIRDLLGGGVVSGGYAAQEDEGLEEKKYEDKQ